MRRKAKPFTLIELLVVIAIIAILASLLFPSLRGALNMGKRVYCANNMKNLSLNAAMYLNDYNNMWFYCIMPDGSHYWWQGDGNPPSLALPTFNSGYLKVAWKPGNYTKGSILDCPSKQDLHGYNGYCNMDYMYNMTLTEKTSRGWQSKNANVKCPSRTPAFGEIIDFTEEANSHFFYCWTGTYNWSPPDGGRVFEWTTHMGMDNFAFVDGHVSAHKRSQVLDKNIFVWDTRQEN